MQKRACFVLKLLQQSAVYSILNEHLRIRSNAGGEKSLLAKISFLLIPDAHNYASHQGFCFRYDNNS